MKTILKKHPLAIRWFHWINFPVLAVMIWSGLLIYWAYDPYKINIAGREYFHFFLKSFYNTLNIPYRLAEGMSFHFAFAWLFILNGILYILYTVSPANGDTFYPINILLKKPGRFYCTICTSANIIRHRINTMLRNALLIRPLLSWA